MRQLILSLRDSDLLYGLRRSPDALISLLVITIILATSFLAPLLAPHDPFDSASLDLMDAFTPPVWSGEGKWTFLLGTDDQGRDLLSAILYGSRISLIVGGGAVIFSTLLGVTLGLLAGYFGGVIDAAIMRAADIQLTFPAILVALLFDGAVRGLIGQQGMGNVTLFVLIAAIGFSKWVDYARVVRGSVLVERRKEYVLAAMILGRSPQSILVFHILPNVLGPVFVLGTINLGVGIITEATLSFLGVGMPPTQPSLGTLIRIGNNFLLSGEWWIVFFPGLALAGLVLSFNILGDWLRDAFNPRLR